MKKYNRLRAFAVAVVMAVSSIPFMAIPTEAKSESEMPDFSYLGAVGTLTEYQTQVVAERIYTALEQHSNSVDVTCSEPILYEDGNMDNPESIRDVYLSIITNYDIGILAAPYGLGCQPRYNSTTRNFELSEFKFTYLVDDSDYEDTYTLVSAQLDDISALVNDDWSDVEKALFLHEYITMHFSYDHNYSTYSFEREKECHTAYGMLTYGKGVCDGYANLYSFLLQREGIFAPAITSKALTHAWNAVYLNGEWVYVDVTFDDDDRRTGSTRHSNFLKNFEELQDTDHLSEDWKTHYGMTIDEIQTSDNYHDAFWNDSICSVQYYNGVWVFVTKDENNEQTAHYRWLDVHTGDCGEYFSDTVTWYVVNKTSTYYPGNFTVIGVYGDYLIYTEPNAIMYYNGSENYCLYSLTDEEQSAGRIYGMRIDGDSLYYELGSSPNALGGTFELDLSDFSFAPAELPPVQETTTETANATTQPTTTTTTTESTTTNTTTTTTTTTASETTTKKTKPTKESTTQTTTQTTTETTTQTTAVTTASTTSTETTMTETATETEVTATSEAPETAQPAETTTTEPPVFAGDINGNSVIEVSDLIAVQQYLHNTAPFSESQFVMADMNGDGAVNVVDLALLKYHLINQ